MTTLPVQNAEVTIKLLVTVPACCKPDQMEGVARKVARSLYHTVGANVRVRHYVDADSKPLDVTYNPT